MSLFQRCVRYHRVITWPQVHIQNLFQPLVYYFKARNSGGFQLYVSYHLELSKFVVVSLISALCIHLIVTYSILYFTFYCKDSMFLASKSHYLDTPFINSKIKRKIIWKFHSISISQVYSNQCLETYVQT